MTEYPERTELVVIAHNMRSAYNVGALLRTADVFAVHTVYCTGYTPYPRQRDDTRSPELISRLGHKIHKSALGAEETVRCLHHPGISALLAELRAEGYTIAGLEVDDRAVNLAGYRPPAKLALLLGEEVHGIPVKLRASCDELLEIPMHGTKDSLNVSVASGIALYALRSG
ncbi:TrmH family RNA methyltransferase [Sciscionella sediminilitoris]|uniref:TrmH family RNA methyltransferase n=1 Tax=Sciscionella sediminilitoris TaxID=1445613 RepID=UPI0004DF1650|nr:TrmH family RNA methyltransferase [Sciscionella sp. SE31]